ncbi:HNH endonuclease [Nocardia goodfellowii]
MKLSVLTREAVLAAIAECDKVGRSEFLRRCRLKPAREYYLLHSGRAYDAKAIAGFAYTLIESDAHPWGAPSGLVVMGRLQELGFEGSAKMEWRTEELILAGDFLHQHDWDEIPYWKLRKLARPLSEMLRSQWVYAFSIPEYRDADIICKKLADLRSAYFDPPSRVPRGRERTVQVAIAFAQDPDGMHALAGTLWTDLQLDLDSGDDIDVSSDTALGSTIPPAEMLTAAVEGRAIQRRSRVYERDPKLRKRKIDQSRDLRGNIACEVCEFDFEKIYPEIGEGFVHVHHAVPLHTTGRVRTTLNDLALLCANCHQMIHRPTKWLTVAELRAIVRSA